MTASERDPRRQDEGPVSIPADLEDDFHQLEMAWTPLPDEELPPDLVAGTLARLRREGLLTATTVQLGARPRLAMLAGIAAALVLVAGLWQAEWSLIMPVDGQQLEVSPAWAEGLELSEHFDSSSSEVEIRLARVNKLLSMDVPPRESMDETDALRSRMDRLAEDLEAF